MEIDLYKSLLDKQRNKYSRRFDETDLTIIKNGLLKNEIPQDLIPLIITALIRSIMPAPEQSTVDVVNTSIAKIQENGETVKTAAGVMLAIPEQQNVIDYNFSSWIISKAIQMDIASEFVYQIILDNLSNPNETVQNCIRDVLDFIDKGIGSHNALIDFLVDVIKAPEASDEIKYPALELLRGIILETSFHPYFEKLHPVWELGRTRLLNIKEYGFLNLPLDMEYRADQKFVLLIAEMLYHLNLTHEIVNDQLAGSLIKVIYSLSSRGIWRPC